MTPFKILYWTVIFANIGSALATNSSSIPAPQITVDPTWWSEYNITTDTVFRFIANTYSSVYIRCLAKYPIEWVYEYPREHAHLYEADSVQWVSSTRNYNQSDFHNANLFTYKSSIRFSCNHNFAAKKILMCQSVSEPSTRTIIEAQYVTAEVARSFNILDHDRYNSPTNIGVKYLLVRPVSETQPGDVEAPGPTTDQNCTANFYVRELNDGRDPPKWKCTNENGTTGSIEFKYCRRGIACANLFRSGQQSMDKSCAKNVEKIEGQSCEGCISSRSFEPGMAYCSIDGETIGAQQFFYSFRRTELQASTNDVEAPLIVSSPFPQFTLAFSWDEVSAEDMLFTGPFNQTLYAGDYVRVTCYYSELYFNTQRISLVLQNGTVQFLAISLIYIQKYNALVATTLIRLGTTVDAHDFQFAQCWGGVWNSIEWVCINTSHTNAITLSAAIKPHFANPEEYLDLYAWDPIHLSCLDSRAAPTPTYNWTFNGSSILPSSRGASTYYSGLRNFHSEEYSFSSSYVGHTGIYGCNATNSGGSSVKVFHVVVHSDPNPTFLSTGGARILYVGESQVSLNCTAKGKPPLAYSWTRSDAALNSDPGLPGNSSVLLFRSVKMTDSGTYYCRASNRDANKTLQFDVTVKEPVPPKFVLYEETFYIYPSSPVDADKWVYSTKACKLEAGDPTPTVQFLTSDNGSIIAIAAFVPGEYICKAFNKFGNSNCVPPRFDSDMEVIAFEWGSINKSITCDLQAGDPPPLISWTKKSVVPVTHGNLTLTFDFVTIADEGKYICEASNWAGTARKLFVVTVHQKSKLSTELRDDSSNIGLRVTLFVILVIVAGFSMLMIHWKLKVISRLAHSKSEEQEFPEILN